MKFVHKKYCPEYKNNPDKPSPGDIFFPGRDEFSLIELKNCWYLCKVNFICLSQLIQVQVTGATVWEGRSRLSGSDILIDNLEQVWLTTSTVNQAPAPTIQRLDPLSKNPIYLIFQEHPWHDILKDTIISLLQIQITDVEWLDKPPRPLRYPPKGIELV